MSWLSALNVGGNAHYTSKRIVQEVVGILADQIENAQVSAMSHSQYYGLMIDESTDISTTKQLVLYGRYINQEGDPSSAFLKIMDLFDGTAERIVETITTYLEGQKLLLNKLMGFGSDGASVMTGRVSGVATRLNRINPYLVSIHCVVALAVSQASEQVEYIKKFKRSLASIYSFFHAVLCELKV